MRDRPFSGTPVTQHHITVREFNAGLGHETAQTNRQRRYPQMSGNRAVQMTQGTPA